MGWPDQIVPSELSFQKRTSIHQQVHYLGDFKLVTTLISMQSTKIKTISHVERIVAYDKRWSKPILSKKGSMLN